MEYQTYTATISEIVETYKLIPHPEGGFYREVYRSAHALSTAALKHQFDGERNYCTSIYFLLTGTNFSAFHRIKQDEVWHFYGGHPLTVHVIDEQGKYTAHHVGFDLKNGVEPQLVVPAGCWFASSVDGDTTMSSFSFVGCTVAPGFDFRDFELANRAELIETYPKHKAIISRLTRD